MAWVLALGWLFTASAARAQCPGWTAVVVSVEGTVELRRSEGETWQRVSLGDNLCIGDSLRADAWSRAAVSLPDEAQVRLDAGTTLTFAEPRDDRRTWVEVLRGLIHVISRSPRALRVTTPFANAGLEGTEFSVRVDDSAADVTVYEGTVVFDNGTDAIDVGAGQRSTAASNRIDAPRDLSNLRQTRQWAQYYPVILAGDLPAPDAPVATQADAAAFLARRAQTRLSLGRIDDATADIRAALQRKPDAAEALALQAMIMLAGGDSAAAADGVARALAADPAVAAALVARSYVEQKLLDLGGARASLLEAAELEPSNAIVWSRLAEIDVALGSTDEGLAAADRAVSIDPRAAAAWVARGFAALAAGRINQAQRSFELAIEADSAVPLARVGLGITLIRRGDLAAGRQQIESAVLLDVNDSLLRSYVAKAYFEELRFALSESQLAQAKTLDPADPTAWLYDALLQQAKNEPITALRNLDRAGALGAGDVYRSSMRLDEDLGTRSAGFGRIFRGLGFENLGLLKGWVSTIEDPAEYAGHRLLADLYSALPRHQIARIDEFYQSQLLQPLLVTPFPPQLAEANLFILDSVGPSDLAHEDLNRVFPERGLSVQGSAITAANDTHGEHVVLAGLRDRVAFNIGRFHYETAGFRPNNDLEHDVSSAFVNFRPSEDLSFQAEIRSVAVEKGDLQLLFDPEKYEADRRHTEGIDSLRLGLARRLGAGSSLLGSFIHEESDAALRASLFDSDGTVRNNQLQFEYIRGGEAWRVQTGASVYRGRRRDRTLVTFPSPVPPNWQQFETFSEDDVSHDALFAYAHGQVAEHLILTLGGAFDALTDVDFEREQFNPKLGLIWQPGDTTTLRASAFRTLQGPLISKQALQPRLEPTHVAGFNQFFYGSQGEDATGIAVGVDRQLSESLHVGVEARGRALEIPTLVAPGPGSGIVTRVVSSDERSQRAYLYWTPTPRIAMSAEVERYDVDNHGVVLFDYFSELTSLRAPIGVRYFGRSGLTAGLTTSYVRQDGVFAEAQNPGPGPQSLVPGADRFWIVDASLGFRLPDRRGSIELGVYNLLDKEFRFQDIDPENPRIFPERFAALRFTLSY